MNDLHDSNMPNAGVEILDFNDQPHNLLIIDSKTVTKCLTSRLMVESKVKKKITERYHLTQEAWLCIYLLPQLTVKNNKIKDFQYMILHSFLPTNDLLFKMNKIPSYLCSFCNMYKESIAHMFYECFLVHNLWLELSNQDDFKCLSGMKLKEKDILYGYFIEGNEKTTIININKMILYVKYYVWKCRLSCIKTMSYTRFKSWLEKHMCYDELLKPQEALNDQAEI